MTLERHLHHIAGVPTPPSSGQWFPSENPYTVTAWAEIARGNAQDVDRAATAAHRALAEGPWGQLTATARGRLLNRLGELMVRDADALAAVEVRDNGKLLVEMRMQMHYAAQWFHYFGGLADKVEGAVPSLDKKGYLAFTRHEPLGVVGIITPWNAPLFLLVWKLAPALAAGCTVVIKPSEFASASTLRFVQLVEEAGFPPGVVNVVTGYGQEVGQPLVEHPLVRKISFTGSDATGRTIGALAAQHLKPITMELGGKSPNIVFEDADIDAAVDGAVSGIFAASGQTCLAGSRLLLHRRIHDAFIDRLVAKVRTARLGDPADPATQIGPITTPPQFEKVLHYIATAIAEGAKLEVGGHRAQTPQTGGGRFVEPTVFSGVGNGMRIAQEEVFGPVLAVIPFDDEEEAVRIANDSRYGLGAGVWTQDIGRAIRMSERLQCGTVWVNTYRTVSFMVPFGGYKDSGIGRENGVDAIRDYLQAKSVWINAGPAMSNPFVMR